MTTNVLHQNFVTSLTCFSSEEKKIPDFKLRKFPNKQINQPKKSLSSNV